MSWLPHTIFHCHERQDSITRDAQGMKQACVSVSVRVRGEYKANVWPLSLYQAIKGLPEILRPSCERVHKSQKLY